MLPPSVIRTGVLAALISSATFAADSVLAVLSSSAAPYQAAAQGVSRALGSDFSVTIVELGAEPPSLSGAACVVAIGRQATTVLHRQLDGPPIIYCLITDPVADGLAPTPPISGVTSSVPLDEQFRLLASALPNCRRIGVLHADNDETLITTIRAVLPAGWTLKPVGFADSERMTDHITDVVTGVDVVWTHPDGAIYTDGTVRALLLTALRRRIPVFGFSPAFVRAGALLGVGIDPGTQGQQAGELVRARLTGPASNESDLPVRLTPTYQLALNLTVAEQLGITLPAQLLSSADQIFGKSR